jgi:hypothetical protein
VSEQELIDCLLLARCDVFVHGASPVAALARLFNAQLPHTNVLLSRISAP